jgi:hypothetical protein
MLKRKLSVPNDKETQRPALSNTFISYDELDGEGKIRVYKTLLGKRLRKQSRRRQKIKQEDNVNVIVMVANNSGRAV